LRKIYFLFAVIIFSAFILNGCGNEEKPKTEMKKDTVTKQESQQTQETKKDTVVKKDSVVKKEDPFADGENTIEMVTNMGTIKIKMYYEKTPITCEHIKSLVKKGFYNGVIFHRVIDGFMIQGGDPTGKGSGGSGKKIKDEFVSDLKHSKAGIVSMANAGPNTGDSQFFICLGPQPHLDGKHTVWGEVTSGMDVVKKIGKVKTDPSDKPIDEVKIKEAKMVSK